MKNTRIELLQKKITDKNLDSLIVSNINNIRYLTGYRGDFGYLVVNRLNTAFFTSSLYTEEAESSFGKKIPVIEIKENVFKTFSEHDPSLFGRRVGFENESVAYAFFDKLQKSLDSREFVQAGNIIETLRYVKDETEIKTIIRAQQVVEKAFEQALGYVKEGIEERELANEVDYLMRKNGGDEPSFKTIIAGGANASKPHAIPSSYKLKSGDMLIFDMGSFVDGYASDMTRTVVLGKADSKFREIYAAVLDAQQAAMDVIKTGVKCSYADSAARDLLKERGFGEYFIHTTGHGLGLEIHEFPRLSTLNHTGLSENMVVTVEPGVYITGWGGVRIENMVVVKDNGCENLTNTTREIIEL